MRTAKLLLVCGLLVILSLSTAVLFWPTPQRSSQPVPFAGQDVTVRVQQRVNFGSGATPLPESIDLPLGSTVLDALRSTHTVQEKAYAFGTLVEGIDGVVGGQDAKYWTFSVNGVEATQSASLLPLYGQETIVWEFAAYEE